MCCVPKVKGKKTTFLFASSKKSFYLHYQEKAIFPSHPKKNFMMPDNQIFCCRARYYHFTQIFSCQVITSDSAGWQP